jgi:hypothetical protein
MQVIERDTNVKLNVDCAKIDPQDIQSLKEQYHDISILGG